MPPKSYASVTAPVKAQSIQIKPQSTPTESIEQKKDIPYYFPVLYMRNGQQQHYQTFAAISIALSSTPPTTSLEQLPEEQISSKMKEMVVVLIEKQTGFQYLIFDNWNSYSEWKNYDASKNFDPRYNVALCFATTPSTSGDSLGNLIKADFVPIFKGKDTQKTKDETFVHQLNDDCIECLSLMHAIVNAVNNNEFQRLIRGVCVDFSYNGNKITKEVFHQILCVTEVIA